MRCSHTAHPAFPRSILLALAAVSAAGCTPIEPPQWCEGTTRFDYAPDRDGPVDVIPDDFWTIEDGSTATGIRIDLGLDDTPGLSEQPADYAVVYDHLSELDGWGLTAGITLLFTRPLDPGAIGPENVAIVAFPPDGDPVFIAADVELTDWDTTAILLPRTPLPSGSQAAAVVWTTARADDGLCVAPSIALRELLSPETELARGAEPDPRTPRFAAALEALGKTAADVSAMVVFTTQSGTRLSPIVAEDIASRPPPEPGPFACTYSAADDWTECDGTFEVADYRNDEAFVPADSDGTPLGSYALPTRLWLPGDGTAGPYPTVFYGHGLASDRGQGRAVARLVAQDGLAVISVDAVEHGDHPGRTEAAIEFLEQITFFGVRFDPPSIDGRKLRDNWRQSAWDKLQVLEALEAGFDVNGDGTADLDTDRMVYVGVSLGGIMGPELLALTDVFDGALLSVPGGRTTRIVQDSELFSPLIDFMAPDGITDGDVARFFPILQTVADAGDSMVWAPHVRDDRLAGEARPLLVQVALEDEIVPNSTNDPLVRSLGLIGVGRQIWEVPDVQFVPGPVEDAGFQQFDFVTEHEGEDPQPATHDNITVSLEGWGVAGSFVSDLLEGRTAVIFDPYAEP